MITQPYNPVTFGASGLNTITAVTAVQADGIVSQSRGKLLVNMKTKISLQCPSLLVFYSFLKLYII